MKKILFITIALIAIKKILKKANRKAKRNPEITTIVIGDLKSLIKNGDINEEFVKNN